MEDLSHTDVQLVDMSYWKWRKTNRTTW